MSGRKHVLWSAVVIVAAAAVVGGFALLSKPGGPAVTQGRPARDAVQPVRVAKVQRDTIRSFRELAATVEPTRVARLASPAEGPVTRLAVREGDRVTSGQRLVVIGRTRTTRAKLAADREHLRKVQDEHDRVTRLVGKGAVPGELADQLKADLERARAAVEGGEEQASDFQVRAPWSGIVSQVMVQEGNYVAPRVVLVEVFDPASLVLRVSLPEAIALKIEPGAEAEVRFDAFAGKVFAGRVVRLYPELDRRLRTRVAELAVEGVATLAPGMFARARLAVETFADAVVVPAAAVRVTPEQERVVFTVEDGKARQRTVEVGIEQGDRVQIRSALAIGQLVVVGGHGRLKDGARVKVMAAPGGVGAPGGAGRAKSRPAAAQGGRP